MNRIKTPEAIPVGGTLQGLRLKSRDVAKFGYLFLNRSRWQGRQVVPETCVEKTTRKHVDFNDGRGFGYLWRTGNHTVNGKVIPHFFTPGYGGRANHIAPELDLMIAFNSDVKHNIAFVTKSFTASLIGLAIDHGFVQDVDQKVCSYFPEYTELSNLE